MYKLFCENPFLLILPIFCVVLHFVFAFRPYLDLNVQKWKRLHMSLQDLLLWIQQKDHEIKQQKPLGSDIPTLQKQQIRLRVSFFTSGGFKPFF